MHVNNSKSTVEGGGKESEDFGSVTIKFFRFFLLNSSSQFHGIKKKA